MMLVVRRKVQLCRLSIVPGLVAALFVFGCTSTQPPAATIKPLLETADAAQGKRLYLQCRACHTLEAGGINTVGPNLHGLLGSTAGQAEGFNYSDVLAESGIVWTPATLDKWLTRPSDFLPGNRMIFAGVSDPADRADLIVYLQQATAAAN